MSKTTNKFSPEVREVRRPAFTTQRSIAVVAPRMRASVWDDLRELRDYWKGTLLVEGIYGVDDAARCQEIGVDGVIL